MFEIFLEMKWLFVVGCILPAFSNAITCVHRKDIDKGIFNPIQFILIEKIAIAGNLSTISQ